MADPLIIYPLFLTYKWNLTVPYQQQIAVEINPLVQQAAKFPYTVFWGQKLLLLFRNLIFLFLVQEVVRPHPKTNDNYGYLHQQLTGYRNGCSRRTGRSAQRRSRRQATNRWRDSRYRRRRTQQCRCRKHRLDWKQSDSHSNRRHWC